MDSAVIARGTPGFTGADLANLVNIAATKASLRGFKSVTMKLLEEAKDDIIMGVERKSSAAVMTERDKRMTAAHEAGHALVAYYTPGADPIHKATITPRGNFRVVFFVLCLHCFAMLHCLFPHLSASAVQACLLVRHINSRSVTSLAFRERSCALALPLQWEAVRQRS